MENIQNFLDMEWEFNSKELLREIFNQTLK